MSVKALFLSLCISLALLLVGCGRSKPASSKAPTTATVADDQAQPANLPQDAPPPRSAAVVPAPPPSAAVQSVPAQPVSFGPIPTSMDPVAQAAHQKYQEIRARQADAVKREVEEARAAAIQRSLQDPPENHDGQ